MNLLNRLRAITKSTTTEITDDDCVSFLQAGMTYTVSSIPNELLRFLADDSSDITDDNGYTIQNTDSILEVRRNNVLCDIVPPELSYQTTYSGSLYKATKFFPKYFAIGNKLYIKPAPTTVEVGVVFSVTIPTIDSTTGSTALAYENITHIVVDYAAALSFTALANYYAGLNVDNVTSGNADDALDKAQKLIDDQSGVGGDSLSKSVQGWITSEDADMAVVAINAAQQEVQRAIAEMNKGKEYSAEAQMYFGKANEYFKLAQLELSNYINSNPAIMNMQKEASQQESK